MITVIFPHRTYSQNKLKIKQVIKKYGMSWDDKKNGWVNEATGDSVFIDRSVMEMIMDDSFSEDQPMTLFIESKNEDFINEFESRCKELGGEFKRDVSPIAHVGTPAPVKKVTKVRAGEKDIFIKSGFREAEGNNSATFQEKAYVDMVDISGRWERHKKQLLVEYKKMGMEKELVDLMLHREEIAFRKNNACWVTGEFPTNK